ncbi:GNAT family N-acetyltransferase [Bacillaceae bacterium SIJ1]|uniref:GNAT family N-acetyltransferase n=1 Tax=Litoribacterium kuwaitense TaxID=1398745 RepID=UPI0013ECA72E|nr:GNAT family N-acetyltransferase [Litoribacterium kuwaitense]
MDRNSQGNGFATKGLQLLPGFMHTHFPEVNEVVLGVNQKNHPAIQLYRKVGFIDRGEVFAGPKGPQHILHLPIQSPSKCLQKQKKLSN